MSAHIASGGNCSCVQSFAATVSADARGIASEAKGKLASQDDDAEVSHSPPARLHACLMATAALLPAQYIYTMRTSRMLAFYSCTMVR